MSPPTTPALSTRTMNTDDRSGGEHSDTASMASSRLSIAGLDDCTALENALDVDHARIIKEIEDSAQRVADEIHGHRQPITKQHQRHVSDVPPDPSADPL
ncbi:MAG: hypothetical protein CUN54_10505 [Phototrophicales bacterium]|nr:MAG: hypothetical protein CUN54_10505 [Phototrophicales bacterium]